MYLDEESQVVFSELRNYFDLNRLFFDKYGYSLLEYFIVLSSIFNVYLTSNPEDLSTAWLIDTYSYFKYVKLDNVETITSDFLGNDENRDIWLDETLNNRWDESCFFNHPLILLRDRFLLSYTESSLKAQFYSSLFFKVQTCFKSNLDFNNYNGRVLEIYLDTILKSIMATTQKKYKYIQEFKYKKNQFHSPDIMLKLGQSILVVEVKNRKVSYEGYANGDDKALIESYENLMIKPLQQAIKRTTEIVEGNYHEEIKIDMKYYIMSVTYDTFPLLFSEHKRRKMIKEESALNIGGLYNASIEEFEILLEYIFRKNSKNIFKFLDRLNKEEGTNTILNKMFQDHMIPKLPDIVMNFLDKSYVI